MRLNLIDLPIEATRLAHVGSRVTCNPPVLNTDDDYLVHADYVDERAWAKAGWLCESKDYEGGAPGTFYSFRKGELNVILTTDIVFFSLFMAATNEATRLNILDKRERVKLFSHILYGAPL